MSAYQLIDEPRPSPIAHITVDPMWPLLSYMLGSPFFAWIWFALNSHAIGSPTKRKEFAVIALGVVGLFTGTIVAAVLKAHDVVTDSQMPYIRLILNIFTLTISYVLYVLQNPPFEIYKHFDGKVMNGMPIMLLAILFGGKLQKVIISAVWGVIT